MYLAIINSKEFMSRENYRSKFKTPLQFAVSAIRATDAKREQREPGRADGRENGRAAFTTAPTPRAISIPRRGGWIRGVDGPMAVLVGPWRGTVPGMKVPNSFFEKYKSEKPEEIEEKMISDLIAGDAGDRELVAFERCGQ